VERTQKMDAAKPAEKPGAPFNPDKTTKMNAVDPGFKPEATQKFGPETTQRMGTAGPETTQKIDPTATPGPETTQPLEDSIWKLQEAKRILQGLNQK